MKNKLIFIGIISIVGIYIYFYAKSEYTWSDSITQKMQREDWVLISKIGFVNVMEPWQWFKTPVSKMWFAKKNEMKHLDNFTFVGHIFSVSFDDSKNKVNGNEYLQLFKCDDNSYAILDSIGELNNYDPKRIDWVKTESGPAKEVFYYFCSQSKE